MSEGERSQTSTNPPPPNPPPPNPPPPNQGIVTAALYMMERKIDCFLWLTRLGTIVFTILSLIPLFGVNSYTCYKQALMSNAATSALRLHQRLPRVQFTREFGALLLIEDSCHYLLYSILFIMSYPITLSLLPVFMFAVLHSVSYSLVILQKLGFEGSWAAHSLRSVAEVHQRNILRLVAFSEVCLMPVTVLWLFSGKGSLLTPFAYYRFLSLRYTSRRNPYTRNVFHEMRLILETFANTPDRNPSLKILCNKLINFALYLAPPVPGQ